jgi:hypothetical protein
MTLCSSTAYQNRVWGNLVDKATGETLQLDPDEKADVGIWVEPTDEDGTPIVGAAIIEDLPEDFDYETAFLATETAPSSSSAAAPAKAKGTASAEASAADPAASTSATSVDAPKE